MLELVSTSVFAGIRGICGIKTTSLHATAVSTVASITFGVDLLTVSFHYRV